MLASFLTRPVFSHLFLFVSVAAADLLREQPVSVLTTVGSSGKPEMESRCSNRHLKPCCIVSQI